MIRDYHHVTLVSSVIRHTCHTLYYPYIARPSAWRSDLVIPIHDHMIFFSARSLFDLSYSLIVVPHFSHTRCAVKLGINESTMIHGPWKFSVFNQNDQCNLYDWAVGSPEWWFTGCPIGSNNDRINSAFVIFWFWQKINQKLNWRWDFGRIRTRFLILVNQNSSPNDRTIFNWNRISVFLIKETILEGIFRTFQYFGRCCKRGA